MDRNEEQSSRVQLQSMDKVQPVEMTAEIALPDYRSEISRLLWVRPTLLPPTRFIGNGKADFSGPVRYDILYTGPDGGLYSAQAEEGYAFSVSTEAPAGAMQGQELLAELVPDAVISRVTGPRKLSVRCRMHARVRGYVEKDLTPRTKGADGNSPVERLCEAVECGRVLTADTEHFEISDVVELDAGAGEPRLILADGALFLPDAFAAEGGMRCRGEVLLSLLICREGAEEKEPQLLTRRIPFEREITMEGAAPDCSVRAMGKVTEIRTAVEEGRIQVDVGVALWGEGWAEENVILCRDMFLPGATSECQFGEEKLQGVGVCCNRNFSVSGERALAELNLAQDVQPIYSVADAEIGERRVEGDKTLLSGELHCHTLYRRDAEYAVADFSVPFRTTVDGAWDTVSASATVPSCRVTLARDAIRADAEILLALHGSSEAPARVLTQAAFSPAEAPPRADMEICYPCGSETLWDVGRRYGIPTEALAAANGLSADAPGNADSLAGVKYLLIP